MDSRTLRRWALYAVLVVANILILVSAFSNKVSIKLPALPKSQPSTGTYIYLPLVSKPSDPLTMQKNHTGYVEIEAEQQVLHLVGEISNQSGKNLRNVVIEARLLDRSGMLLESLQGNLALDLLPDGTTSCFNLATTLPEEYENYELKVLSFTQVEGDENAVESYVTNAYFDGDFGWYAVNGVAIYEIGNISGDVAVAATYYDKQKQVIGCEQTFANFPESEVPEPGVFSFYFMGSNAFKVTEAHTLAINAAIREE
ncbi:MAG: FxLYD domain-containing protein [Anaerolineaceae bacterium]